MPANQEETQTVIEWITAVCAPPFNGFAVFALGGGLVAIAASWPVPGDIAEILIVPFTAAVGIFGIDHARKNQGVGLGLTIAGFVCGLAGLTIAIVRLVLVFNPSHGYCWFGCD
jgi:hypothetical protein